MTAKRQQHANTLVRTMALFLAMQVVVGCASTKMAQVDPVDAPQVLERGDNIEITRLDGEFVPLRVVRVSDGEIIGDGIRVPIDDIAAITRYVKVHSDGSVSSGGGASSGGGSSSEISDTLWEIWGLVGLLLLLSAF